jgi:signal peptidase II
LFRDGTVVDFMVMSIGPLRTGVFNVADMAVMAGIFLLFASKLFSPAPEEGVVHGTQDS